MCTETSTLPYTRAEIRHLCKTVNNLAPILHLGDHRVAVHLISVNDFPADLTISEHEHAFCEALITLTGDGKVLGKHGMQPVIPGTVLVFGPHEQHSWLTLDSPHRRLVIWFDVTPALSITPPVQWPVWPEMLTEVELLFRDVSEGTTGWNYRAIARLTIILSRILTLAKWTPLQIIPMLDHPERLAQVIDQFLNDNMGQKVTLSDIAVHLSSSIRRITRDYRRVTGKSIMGRLLELRMAHAATMLEETELTLPAIGDQVGIPDPSYFCHCFRRMYGVSPGNYRNNAPGT